MTIELTTEEQASLAALAQQAHRSEAELARGAVLMMLETEENRLAIQKADEEFERGEFFEHDEIVAQFADILEHS